jgi:glycosyltransferase involved in cell wall biosynthesis
MIAACPFPWPRGTPVRVFRMAQALGEHGSDIHVITYHLGKKDVPGSFFLHRTAKLPFFTKTGPGPSILKLLVADPMLSFKILKLHRKFHFDIIHAHHIEGLLASIPLRLLTHVPIIFDMHTLLETELPFYFRNGPDKIALLKKIGRMLDRRLAGWANHVIGVTEEIKDYLIAEAKIPAEKISVIPNGIELKHFSHTNLLPEKMNDRIILGFAGNCASYQGIDIMLDALDLLRSDYPSLRLHLYTDDTEAALKVVGKKPGLSSLVAVFYSDFNILPAQLSRVDILLNPRPHGAGHPLKLLNYMAAGKPIVSLPGTAHLLSHGATAWVTGDNSARSLADGIAHLITRKDLAVAMGRNARDFLTHRFSWDSRAEEIAEIYRKMIQKRWKKV